MIARAIIIAFAGMLAVLMGMTFMFYPVMSMINESATNYNLFDERSQAFFIDLFYVAAAVMLTLVFGLFIWIVATFVKREEYEWR